MISQVFDPIRIGFIVAHGNTAPANRLLAELDQRHHPKERQSYLVEFPGFSRLFHARAAAAGKGCHVELGQEIEEQLANSTDPHLVLAEALARALFTLDTSRNEIDVLVMILPDRWKRCFYGRRDEDFDLHDYLKAVTASRSIPLQILQEERAFKYRCRCSVMWRLSIALYCKAGGVPWKLADSDPDTAFVGLSYAQRRPDDNRPQFVTCCSQVFDADGAGLEFIAYNTEGAHIERENPYLSRAEMRRAMARSLVLDQRRHAGRNPNRVVVHKSTPFKPGEIDGCFNAWPAGQGLELVQIQQDSAWRAVQIDPPRRRGEKGAPNRYSCRRGSFLQLGGRDVLLFLYTGDAVCYNRPRPVLHPCCSLCRQPTVRELIQRFAAMRRNHPAWLLLASPRGPLMLASLKALLEAHPNGIEFEDGVEQLAMVFADNANDSDYELDDDHPLAARRELRLWLKRGLIVERNGQVLATDALQRSLQFVDLIQDNAMTSTASRLATVQRAIETLEAQLNRSQSEREESLTARIDALKKELTAVRSGQFEVLDGLQAEEGIREIYQLAISLQADFRRVEDSYREADRMLRQRIIGEKQNRGQIVDELLSGHEALIETSEGQVFEGFYAQLVKTTEIDEMKSRLRSILANNNADKALQRKQKTDLRQLVSRLVQESERVIQARAKSERDVRGFLKSGLADEHMRVGAILQDIFQAALQVDWQSQAVRRRPGPLPPLAMSLGNLPLVERLLVKQFDQVGNDEIDLTVSEADPAAMDQELWQALQALNRARLFEATVAHLQASGKPLTLGELAKALPPTHDLETLAYWLAMARQAGITFDERTESIDLRDESDLWTRFHVPALELDYESVRELESGGLE